MSFGFSRSEGAGLRELPPSSSQLASLCSQLLSFCFWVVILPTPLFFRRHQQRTSGRNAQDCPRAGVGVGWGGVGWGGTLRLRVYVHILV